VLTKISLKTREDLDQIFQRLTAKEPRKMRLSKTGRMRLKGTAVRKQAKNE
jgi:hypothetical protein